MAEFLEERLPIGVRMGASYSDEYAVEIVTTKNNAEYRRLLNPYPVRQFTINYTQSRAALWNQVLALYHRAYGMFAGFRVKCIDDFSSNGNTGIPTRLDQPMLRISAGIYQLQKQYGTGGSALSIGFPVRTIYKPVAGTLLVANGGVLVSSGVTVNTSTGRVTISPAPIITDVMTAGFEFDIPCRFNSRIDVAHIGAEVREAGSIDIIEVLNP